MTDVLVVLAQRQEQAPEDVGKAGPLGLLLIVVLLMNALSAFAARKLTKK